MSDLFGWLQNYLNLSKITAVTVPGMVIAFALILVLGPIPCRDDIKNCPYCTDSLKPATASPATAAPETVTAKFVMSSADGKAIGDTEQGKAIADSEALIIDWNEKANGQAKAKSAETSDGKSGETSDNKQNGPTVEFVSASGPDTSEIATYSWRVEDKPICGAPEQPPSTNKPALSKQKSGAAGGASSADTATGAPANESKTGKGTGKSKQDANQNGPGDDPSRKDKDKDTIPGKPSSACGPIILHRFVQPGNYKVTLTVTNKDGKSSSVAGLVVVNPPELPDSKKTPQVKIESCYANQVSGGFCPPDPKRPKDPGQYPDKRVLPFGDTDTTSFDATAAADPKQYFYVWKRDGYPICFAPSCLIDFNTPDGKANPTGDWAITLDVIDKLNPGLKSTAEQIVERQAVPAVTVYPTSLTYLTNVRGFLFDRDRVLYRNIVLDRKQTLKLTFSPGLNITRFAASLSGPDERLFHLYLPDELEKPKGPLKPGPYEITIKYSPSFLVLFGAPRASNANATLEILAVDNSSGVDKQITASIPLSAVPSLDAAVASDDAAKKKKLASNTVITSSATLLKSSADAKGDANRTAVANDINTILTNSLGVSDPAVAGVTSSCKGLPVYVVGGSRPAPSSAASSGDSGNASKQGVPQYAGESATSVEDVLTISDECVLALTNLDQRLQAEIATKTAEAAQASAELTALTASLTAAQTSGNRLVVDDIAPRVQAKTAAVAKAQGAVKSLNQADAYVQGLNTSTSTLEKGVVSQVNSGSSAAGSNAVVDVFTTIQQHFLMFLLFSWIIGQMFDPIQRGLLSFVGPRRNVFIALNKVYGTERGDGEFRYGDRRLPPWTERGTYLPDLNEPRSIAQATIWKRWHDERGLRYSPADFAFRRNMNIYDQNYAIGAQYISQSEFDRIYNEFFRESQITTGLILPLLILAVCIGIRYICCSSYSVAGGSAWFAIGAVIGAIYLAVVLSLFVLALAAWMGSTKYGEVVKEALNLGILGLRYAKDATGQRILKRWRELDEWRTELEKTRVKLADHSELLAAARARLEQESAKLNAETRVDHRECGEIMGMRSRVYEQTALAYMRSLEHFERVRGKGQPEGEERSTKSLDWLTAEGRSLYEECQKMMEKAKAEPGKSDFFEERKAAYEKSKEKYKKQETELNEDREKYEKEREKFRVKRDEFWKGRKEFESDFAKEMRGKRNRRMLLVLAWRDSFGRAMILFLLPALLLIYSNRGILRFEMLPIIALPALFLAPLWVAGLDRLHKYYSELQARIAGNILRLQQNTIQKMVDIVTNSESRKDLVTNLDTAVTEQATLLNFLQSSVTKKTSTQAASAGQDPQSQGLEPLTMKSEDGVDMGGIEPDPNGGLP